MLTLTICFRIHEAIRVSEGLRLCLDAFVDTFVVYTSWYSALLKMYILKTKLCSEEYKYRRCMFTIHRPAEYSGESKHGNSWYVSVVAMLAVVSWIMRCTQGRVGDWFIYLFIYLWFVIARIRVLVMPRSCGPPSSPLHLSYRLIFCTTTVLLSPALRTRFFVQALPML